MTSHTCSLVGQLGQSETRKVMKRSVKVLRKIQQRSLLVNLRSQYIENLLFQSDCVSCVMILLTLPFVVILMSILLFHVLSATHISSQKLGSYSKNNRKEIHLCINSWLKLKQINQRKRSKNFFLKIKIECYDK